MLNFEDDFTPATQPVNVPSFLRKESAPVEADVAEAPVAPESQRVRASDKRIINGATDVNQLVPFKYKWPGRNTWTPAPTTGCRRK